MARFYQQGLTSRDMAHLGRAVGQGAGGVLRRRQTAAADRDVQSFNEDVAARMHSGEMVDPLTYQAGLLQILRKNGLKPGRIFEQLSQTHAQLYQDAIQEQQAGREQQQQEERDLSRRIGLGSFLAAQGANPATVRAGMTGVLDANQATQFLPQQTPGPAYDLEGFARAGDRYAEGDVSGARRAAFLGGVDKNLSTLYPDIETEAAAATPGSKFYPTLGGMVSAPTPEQPGGAFYPTQGLPVQGPGGPGGSSIELNREVTRLTAGMNAVLREFGGREALALPDLSGEQDITPQTLMQLGNALFNSQQSNAYQNLAQAAQTNAHAAVQKERYDRAMDRLWGIILNQGPGQGPGVGDVPQQRFFNKQGAELTR